MAGNARPKLATGGSPPVLDAMSSATVATCAAILNFPIRDAEDVALDADPVLRKRRQQDDDEQGHDEDARQRQCVRKIKHASPLLSLVSVRFGSRGFSYEAEFRSRARGVSRLRLRFIHSCM